MACRHLLNRGYAILEKNYRCRYGEVDIVAQKGAELVFTEVRTRHGTARSLVLRKNLSLQPRPSI